MEESLLRFISDGTPESIIRRYASLNKIANEADFGEFDRNIVVVDTETTGFSLNHDELTQIAAARLEKGEITDWFITFVNPGKPIPDDVAHLTNIHDEDVADAPSPSDALAQLVEFVGDSKVVAHNAEFDRNFTTKHPSGYPLLDNTWIDSLDLARIALPRMKSHRLIDLVKAFGAPLSTHRADEDVAATCALFRILLAAVSTMPAPLVRTIAHMTTPDKWSTSVVFDYFARELTQKEIDEAESDNFKPVSFSLRSMRRERVGAAASHARAKKDPMKPLMPTDSSMNTAGVTEDDAANHILAPLVFPSPEEVEKAFSPEGVVGSLYEDYEPRAEQLEMSQAICRAFTKSDNLTVEAGTGVGKSMAYLLPSVLTSVRNNIAIGVATKTNALLDQLVYQELPALVKALEDEGVIKADEFSYAPLKGFSHYPCLRKIESLVNSGVEMRKVGTEERSQAPALAALLSYVEQTDYDDLDGLKIDYRVLPRRMVTTTSHDCLRRKCPFYGTACFVHGARRTAESANIIVTNHSLLFCDLAADGGLLPPVRFWVVDEAHGAENEARKAFSLELSADDVDSLAQRVASEDSTRNVFTWAERNVVKPGGGDDGTLFFSLTSKAKNAGRAFSEVEKEFSGHFRDLLYYDTTKKSKGYEYVDLWINEEIRHGTPFKTISSFARTLIERSEKLVTACQELVGYLEDVEGAAVSQREIASLAMELKDVIWACEVIFMQESDAYVYAAHLCRKADKGGNKLEALLYNVGTTLNDTLYESTLSVVYASATLTVGNSFRSFESALGLNESEHSQSASLALSSSYDYDNQMTIYVIDDIPEPSDPRYLSALQSLLIEVHEAQRGSMLTLFTNRKEMEKCFDEVQPVLKADDLRLVCQKWGVSVKGLRDDFLADEHLSLFALKSFWEGFDAPGATLKGVIIPKLPFAKPTDPLSCERAARDDHAWRKYVLPAAVLETKQAAGRLIRKATDEGVLILADKRLITKSYGKTFLKSLPSKNIRICSTAEVVDDIMRRSAR